MQRNKSFERFGFVFEYEICFGYINRKYKRIWLRDPLSRAMISDDDVVNLACYYQVCNLLAIYRTDNSKDDRIQMANYFLIPEGYYSDENGEVLFADFIDTGSDLYRRAKKVDNTLSLIFSGKYGKHGVPLIVA